MQQFSKATGMDWNEIQKNPIALLLCQAGLEQDDSYDYLSQLSKFFDSDEFKKASDTDSFKEILSEYIASTQNDTNYLTIITDVLGCAKTVKSYGADSKEILQNPEITADIGSYLADVVKNSLSDIAVSNEMMRSAACPWPNIAGYINLYNSKVDNIRNTLNDALVQYFEGKGVDEENAWYTAGLVSESMLGKILEENGVDLEYINKLDASELKEKDLQDPNNKFNKFLDFLSEVDADSIIDTLELNKSKSANAPSNGRSNSPYRDPLWVDLFDTISTAIDQVCLASEALSIVSYSTGIGAEVGLLSDAAGLGLGLASTALKYFADCGRSGVTLRDANKRAIANLARTAVSAIPGIGACEDLTVEITSRITGQDPYEIAMAHTVSDESVNKDYNLNHEIADILKDYIYDSIQNGGEPVWSELYEQVNNGYISSESWSKLTQDGQRQFAYFLKCTEGKIAENQAKAEGIEFFYQRMRLPDGTPTYIYRGETYSSENEIFDVMRQRDGYNPAKGHRIAANTPEADKEYFGEYKLREQKVDWVVKLPNVNVLGKKANRNVYCGVKCGQQTADALRNYVAATEKGSYDEQGNYTTEYDAAEDIQNRIDQYVSQGYSAEEACRKIADEVCSTFNGMSCSNDAGSKLHAAVAEGSAFYGVEPQEITEQITKFANMCASYLGVVCDENFLSELVAVFGASLAFAYVDSNGNAKIDTDAIIANAFAKLEQGTYTRDENGKWVYSPDISGTSSSYSASHGAAEWQAWYEYNTSGAADRYKSYSDYCTANKIVDNWGSHIGGIQIELLGLTNNIPQLVAGSVAYIPGLGYTYIAPGDDEWYSEIMHWAQYYAEQERMKQEHSGQLMSAPDKDKLLYTKIDSQMVMLSEGERCLQLLKNRYS